MSCSTKVNLMNNNKSEFKIYLSPADKNRFGVKTARAVEVTERDIPAIFDFCRQNQIEFLIARSQCHEIKAAQALEKEGGVLVDSLILFWRNLLLNPIPATSGNYIIREIRDGEADTVKAVAWEAFQDYGGHYQSDERLDIAASGDIYSSWAYNEALNRDRDHTVIVAEKKDTIIGFTLVRMNTPAEGEGTLEGVLPTEVKRSLVQRDMAIGAKNWARSRGANRFIASVMLTNTVMQKIILRLGYEPFRSYYTFHKWFK